MNRPHILTASTGFYDERLASHVEARRQQRALERAIDGPFNPAISSMLDQIATMELTTSTSDAK